MSGSPQPGLDRSASTLHSLDDVASSAAVTTTAAAAAAAPNPAAATLAGLDDMETSTPTAAAPRTASAYHTASGQGTRFGSHYLLTAGSEASSATGSDSSGTPLQPTPLPAITLPMLPAAATARTESGSDSSYGQFGTPRSRLSDTGSFVSLGSLPEQDSATAKTQALLAQQRSNSPLRTATGADSGTTSPARTSSPGRPQLQGRSSSPGMVAAGVMGTSITLQPKEKHQMPLPLEQQQQQQQRSPLGDIERSSTAAVDHPGTTLHSLEDVAPSTAAPAAATAPAGGQSATPGVAAAAAAVPAAGALAAAAAASSSGGGSAAKPPRTKSSRSKSGKKGDDATIAGSSSKSSTKQQQQTAVAALTADIIAAAAAGAAAGAALAAIAEVGEDQQQRQLQQQGAAKAGGPAAASASLPTANPGASKLASANTDSPRSIASSSASSAPSLQGFSVLDPAAAAAAAASARRRSRSSRSRAPSAAGAKAASEAAADIEQPPAMTPRQVQQQQKQESRRSSAGVGKKTLVGSLTALLGVAAWKRGVKRPVDTTPSGAITPPAEPPVPTPETKKQPRSTLFRPDPAPDRKKKCIRWTMLACLLLALLFGIAVAIAVPVSRQRNAARDAAAAAPAAAAAKSARGAPLTFRVDVAVPPDEEDDAAGPLCGSLFSRAQDSSQSVEGFLGVVRKTYANALKVKPTEVNISSVTCNNKPIRAAPPTTLPRPALKRMLLTAADPSTTDSSSSNIRFPAGGAAGGRVLAQAAAAPAMLSTEFQVPAPADPTERAKVESQIKESSQGLLTAPLSEFFGREVTVSTPVALAEPTRRPAAPAAGSAIPVTVAAPRTPRALPPLPLPKPSPSPLPPSPELVEEVEVEVIEEPAAGNTTQPRAQLPGRSPQPKPSPAPKEDEQVEQEIPSVPLALPKMSPRPRMNGTKVAPPPSPAVNKTMAAKAPPAPKVIVWSVAPACKSKPDGQNSVPDSEGRLWGWQQGESCTFKTILRTPVYITWSNAPTCKDMPATSNSIYDRSGRLWGWEDDRSCAFRGTRLQSPSSPGQQVLVWSTAPTCKGSPSAMNSVKAKAGEIWGWEDGQSCAFRINNNGKSWLEAPKCKGLSNYYNSVRDTVGRSWGWEDNRSCRF